ncbi:hypothetical protein [Nocardia abscessus]|uniref:hypothetical protein n=1 Tax=Nocardia abscessus TaxID=120957 RepID=UPI00245399EF|nr:hypothetical protein [Nocardia abscessus]
MADSTTDILRTTVIIGSTRDGRFGPVADIGELLDRMERDEFDLVAVGRALLGDPEWPAKVLAGRIDELTPFHGGLLGSLR